MFFTLEASGFIDVKVKRFLLKGKKSYFKTLNENEKKTFARDNILLEQKKNYTMRMKKMFSIQLSFSICNALRQCSLSIWFCSEISQHSAAAAAATFYITFLRPCLLLFLRIRMRTKPSFLAFVFHALNDFQEKVQVAEK